MDFQPKKLHSQHFVAKQKPKLKKKTADNIIIIIIIQMKIGFIVEIAFPKLAHNRNIDLLTTR